MTHPGLPTRASLVQTGSTHLTVTAGVPNLYSVNAGSREARISVFSTGETEPPKLSKTMFSFT